MRIGLYSIELDKMRHDWGFCSIRKDKLSYGKKLYGWRFIENAETRYA